MALKSAAERVSSGACALGRNVSVRIAPGARYSGHISHGHAIVVKSYTPLPWAHRGGGGGGVMVGNLHIFAIPRT
jgi:hypothetical protein